MGWLGGHWADVILAVALAIIFAVIADYLQIGSSVRDRIRKYKNRRAEQSLTRLRKRIIEMEDYKRKLSYDRWIYLRAFRLMFSTLFSMTVAIILVTLPEIGSNLYTNQYFPFPVHDVLRATRLHGMTIIARAIGVYFLMVSLLSSYTGMKVVSMDTREKVQKQIEEVDREIAGLKARLAEMDSELTGE